MHNGVYKQLTKEKALFLLSFKADELKHVKIAAGLLNMTSCLVLYCFR